MNVPLHEVIRPGDRDQCGMMGEALHQLADDIEKWCPDVVVKQEATMPQIFECLSDSLGCLPTRTEGDLRERHEAALKRLAEHATAVV